MVAHGYRSVRKACVIVGLLISQTLNCESGAVLIKEKSPFTLDGHMWNRCNAKGHVRGPTSMCRWNYAQGSDD